MTDLLGMGEITMKTAIRLIAALLLAVSADAQTASTPAQDKPRDQLRIMSREELDITKVVLAQEKAWNAGDIDAYAQAYKDSPDLLFLGGHVTHGYAEMLNDYRRSYPNREAMGTLSFSEIEPHVLDARFAVLVGSYHLERTKKAGGSADGFFSLVLEKTDKGWKIVVDHST
jgi:uncharacterized protein (TIGR02246 family)